MNRLKTITAFIFAVVLGCFAQTWDILDKSMVTWDKNDGADTQKAWNVTAPKGSTITATVKEGKYANLTKMQTAVIGKGSAYAFLTPQPLTLVSGLAYSFEVKARVNAYDKNTYPDDTQFYEANQISARLNKRNMTIFIKCGDTNNGYVSLTSGRTHKDEEKYMLNTNDWHTYRFVFHAGNEYYDVYVDDREAPIFEDVPTEPQDGSNILRIGAETDRRCDIDVEYVRMGTGNFWSKTKIVSVILSAASQVENKEAAVTATVHTVQIKDKEKLLVSLVDGAGQVVVPAVEAEVKQDKAVAQLIIPASVPKGAYFVKAAVENDKIGEIDVVPKMAEYAVLNAAFAGKNLATFGNSITAASNSWAYRVRDFLGFGHLYNGAVSASIWYEREQRFDDGTVVRTQDYTDPKFAGITSEHYENMKPDKWQQRVNNCAVVHVQKYLAERKNLPVANQTPDYIIFSYGTNDPVDFRGDPKEVLAAKDLSEVNTFTTAGAFRWCVDTMRMVFPDVKIYFSFPLQTSESRGWNANNLIKIEMFKEMCEGLDVPYFDCFHESGITTENASKYLPDGLHPNAAGQILQGEYIARKLDEIVSAETSVVVLQTVDKESVSVSTTLLKAGQTLSVQSLKKDIALSGVTLYGMDGSEICRIAACGEEYKFQAPLAAGAYILAVGLADNTSQGFKIMVK